jgi:hypothetical protein
MIELSTVLEDIERGMNTDNRSSTQCERIPRNSLNSKFAGNFNWKVLGPTHTVKIQKRTHQFRCNILIIKK